MKGFRLRTISTLLISGVVVACGQTESPEVETGGLYAIFYVEDNGNNETKVEAALKNGNPLSDYIDLDGGDRLVAEAFGQRKTLSENKSGLFGSVTYKGTFDQPGARETVYIRLYRENDPDAPDSHVTLPPGPDLQLPESGKVYGYNEDIPVVWPPSDIGELTLTTIVSCSVPGSDYDSSSVKTVTEIPDDGSTPVTAKPLLDRMVTDAATMDCNLEVKLSRCKGGHLDPEYGVPRGTINGCQNRHRKVPIDTTNYVPPADPPV